MLLSLILVSSHLPDFVHAALRCKSCNMALGGVYTALSHCVTFRS